MWNESEKSSPHPKVDSLLEYQKSHNNEKCEMEGSRSCSRSSFEKSSDFALLTNKVVLLKNILQIIQQDDKCTNTIEFTKDMIHICSKDALAIQVVDLDPEKMGRYHPPKENSACTFHCSNLVKFFKSYVNNIVVSISKPQGVNDLQIRIFENNIFASDIVVTLDSEDSVQYVDDSEWDSEPHMMISIANFCTLMKYTRQQTSSDITGYAKHMKILSEHKVNMVSSTKVYGTEPPSVVIDNPEVSQLWEKLVEKHLGKMKPAHLDKIPSYNLVVLNQPIAMCHANAKLMSLLSKIKALTRTDRQMLSCYYHPDLPMKIELDIKDGGVTVGTYKIYILGTSVHPDTLSSSKLTMGGKEYSDSRSNLSSLGHDGCKQL